MSETILSQCEPGGNGAGSLPQSEPSANRVAGDIPPNPVAPESIRLSQDFAASIGVRRVYTRIRYGKPEKHEFVRVRAGEAWRLETALLERKGSEEEPGQETFSVAPALWPKLPGDIRPAVLFPAVNRQMRFLLWRCWLPSSDGRANDWTDTMLDAARLAERTWIRVAAGASQYEIVEAAARLSEPEWPAWPLEEWVRLAFQDRYIDSPTIRSFERCGGWCEYLRLSATLPRGVAV